MWCAHHNLVEMEITLDLVLLMLSPMKINDLLLTLKLCLSEKILPMQLLCSCVELHHTPDQHEPLRREWVTFKAEYEQS